MIVDRAVPSASADVDRTDAELLEAFVARRREEAFAELVHRHGPMVMGVCRRQLGNRADAEDAFQVTFLVLAKNAASVRRRERLGSWLFGVARRVARKAQQQSSRRRAGHTRLIHMLTNTRPDSDPPAELLAFLDEEIERLPAQYRAAVVSCYLEGKTNRDAAKALGWPEGTLVTRLNRAKEALRTRAAAKGLTPSVTSIGAALTQHFSPAPALPPALVASTSKAAAVHVAGQGVSTLISSRAASLLHDTTRMFFWAKVKVVAAIVAGVIALGTGTALLSSHFLTGRGDGLALSAKEADLTAMPALPEGTADAALLKSVRSLRARAFAAARAGRGVAQDDGAYDDLGSDRTLRDRRGRVRFAFSSGRFLTRVQFPEEPGAALAYAGVGDRVLAFRSLSPDPPFAQISRPGGSTLDHKPLNWSVEQIARISPWSGDDEFFEYLLNGDRSQVDWRIKREGAVLRLKVDNHPGGAYSGRVANSVMLVEFDMSHHGMTSSFRFEREATEDTGAHRTEIQLHQIAWRASGDADVPVERHVTLAGRQGEGVKVQSSSVVRFEAYELGPVAKESLDADTLGIPDGTQVHDETDPRDALRVWKTGSFR